MLQQPNNKYGISNNYPLTVITTRLTLESVPSHQTTRYNFKQTTGGNVTNTQPPIRRGFFVPAVLGDCNELSAVAEDRKPTIVGKIRSAPSRAFEVSRQLYCCQNFKKLTGSDAMQNANAQTTTTPVVNGIKGFTCPTSTQSNGRCLIHSNTLLDTLLRAKAKDRKEERGNGYHELLREFHRTILPAFVLEAGSISKASNLLGLHRETLTRYIDHAGIDMNKRAGGVQ